MKWPDAAPFDPLQGIASPAIEIVLERPGSTGPVLLLAVGPLAQESGWAAEAAIALTNAFAERGETVILADLSLLRPELHTVLGTDNEEGLSDVFLFGASLPHITQTIPGKSFRLIPASPFTPDASEVLTHARWSGLFEEFATQQSKLLVYLPVDVDGAAAFSDRVGHTLILAEPAELAMVRAVLSEDADVLGVLVPPGTVPVAAPKKSAIEATSPLPTPVPAAPVPKRDDAAFEKIRIPKDRARESLIADLRTRQRAALMAPAPAMTPLPFEEGGTGRLGGRGTGGGTPGQVFRIRAMHPGQKGARPVWPWLLGILLLVAAGAGGWYYWDTMRSNTASAVAPVPQVRRPVSQAPSPTVPESPGTPLPYSVAIASFQLLSLADEHVKQLRDDDPQLSFYIDPIVVQGTLFYRVMAGPVADSITAAALRDTLIAKRIKTITSGWDVLSTPYAFFLGEYASRGAAEAQQGNAASKGIPTYIVEGTGPQGSTQYKLYAGAYTGPGDAEFMRPILKAAGLPENLVERIGSIRS